jgi:predicted AlkP superfamily phosphohydrolase/phosphomutase
MREVRASEVCTLDPFWRNFGAEGPRSVVIDVPLVPLPKPIHGVEVCCYGTHERLVPFATEPPELAQYLEKSIGRLPMEEEIHHRVSYDRLLRERNMLIETTGYVAEMADHLLGDEEWGFGLVCFSACHRAGHKLWNASGSNGKGTAAEATELTRALRDVYVAVDTAVGRIVDLAGPDTDVLAFSLHGTGPNTSYVPILPDLLDRILLDAERESAPGFLRRLRYAISPEARGWAKRRLPVRVQDRLSTFWRTRRDWSKTKAISLAADIHGFIRINLAGREAEGVVSPHDYIAVCDKIAEGLLSFRDVDTGEPVVSQVLRRTDLYKEGAYAERLPDLIVVWCNRPACECESLVSERYGKVNWPTPGSNPDGRSGNHRFQGWLAASGPSIEPGTEICDATILDIAPTVLTLLGHAIPADMAGAPLLPVMARQRVRR